MNAVAVSAQRIVWVVLPYTYFVVVAVVVLVFVFVLFYWHMCHVFTAVVLVRKSNINSTKKSIKDQTQDLSSLPSSSEDDRNEFDWCTVTWNKYVILLNLFPFGNNTNSDKSKCTTFHQHFKMKGWFSWCEWFFVLFCFFDILSFNTVGF